MCDRDFSRTVLHLSATVGHDGDSFPAELTNASLYGMFLRTATRLPIGEPVTVQIDLTGPSSILSISCEGTVRHHQVDGLGVEIEQIAPDSFLHWKSLLAYALGDLDQLEREFAEYIANKQARIEEGD